MSQKPITLDTLSQLSPIIAAQNKLLLTCIAEKFQIDIKKLNSAILPHYMDFLHLYINGEKTRCTEIFPEIGILCPNEHCCHARIKEGSTVHQCPHEKTDGNFCKFHKEQQPWGCIDTPFVDNSQNLLISLNKQEIDSQEDEIWCEEWIYKGNQYYWDPNSDKIYDLDQNFIGIKKGNSLQIVDN